MSYYCTCFSIWKEAMLYYACSHTEQNNPSHFSVFDADNNEVLLLQFKLAFRRQLPENKTKQNKIIKRNVTKQTH